MLHYVGQLNFILKISFKQKFKKDIIERINSFINLKYGNKTYIELIALKDEITINNNEITVLNLDFFNSYQEEFFNFFNPNWYNNNQNFKRTKKEMNYVIQYYTKDAIHKILQIIPSKLTEFVLAKNTNDNLSKFYLLNYSFNFNNTKLILLDKDKEKIIKKIENKLDSFYSIFYEGTIKNNSIIKTILNNEPFDESILKKEHRITLFIVQEYLFLFLLLKELKGK